jgi:signal transduction histidine kinase
VNERAAPDTGPTDTTVKHVHDNRGGTATRPPRLRLPQRTPAERAALSLRNLTGGASARSRRWLLTAAGFILLGVVMIGFSSHVEAHPDQEPLDLLAYLLILTASLGLAVSWRWPRSATLVVTLVLCVFIVRHYPDGPIWVTGWASLGVLGWHSTRRSALAGGLGMTAALGVSAVATGQGDPVIPAVFLGWCAAAVLLGEALRNRRTYLAGVAERARFAERSRADETARRVAELRLRIAQDLHDTVAHAIVTINVQAAAAAHVLTKDPTVAADALANIQRASADVIDELASMLALLRGDEGVPELVPTPKATDIAALAVSVPDAGLHVDLHSEGPLDRLPPVLSTTTYRLVQECLTNSLKHSRASTVAVALTADPDAGRVTVRVDDPGPARSEAQDAASATRVGLRGMQERVAMTGGALTAGVTPEGAFVVRGTWERVSFL